MFWCKSSSVKAIGNVNVLLTKGICPAVYNIIEKTKLVSGTQLCLGSKLNLSIKFSPLVKLYSKKKKRKSEKLIICIIFCIQRIRTKS